MDAIQYREKCRTWFEDEGIPRHSKEDVLWGQGSDDVSVFHALSGEEELKAIHRGRDWQQRKLSAGFGAIDWPHELGGAGLSARHSQVFREVESEYDVPRSHELLRVTVGLIAPTIREYGTPEQRDRFCSMFLAADQLACQLFSEPGAGSDLAAVSTRAEKVGGEWVVNRSKVWTSGAQFSQWGELLARTDPSLPKHAGLTAFMIPMSGQGTSVRPIRQMTGGSSFCEVFFDDVRISDDLRLGDVGAGWSVALATLGVLKGVRAVRGQWVARGIS